MSTLRVVLFLACLLLSALIGCGGTPAPADAPTAPRSDAPVDPGSLRRYGDVVTGEYHLGPVEWTGSFNNACSPYDASTQALEGELLAGLSNELAGDGSECDACIEITTGRGNTLIARVVTYGVTSAPGNIDVSSAAYAILNEDEFPRAMTFQRITCPTTDPLYFQYQTGANEYWTSLWVRNPRVGVERVEVRSTNHPSFITLARAGDGTFTDASGFGAGSFTLRVTGADGTTFEETFDNFTPGALVRASGNLP